MAPPREIADLVERFEQQGESYRSGFYNEAQLRQEFIDPMFKALGWDMENVSGYAEAYKDVIHEDAIKIGGATKAPDYCFRIGGTRKFFLEAKKPSVDIKTDAHPAFQLRRYAWSAKLPLSVLTDFEEFAAYDCRVKPSLTDKAATARVLYFGFRDYASQWDAIAKVFSREAILKGSFDKFAESTKAKRGTAEVDDAFLGEIENWRADLARNLASRNSKLSQRDLNFSVQRTIDRIVFLRICEDRRVEIYGRLQALLNGEHTYRRLYQLFREADERYNSGLFHFQKEKDRVELPDDLTPGLEIDDAVLKKIIRRLYYPESPYEFSVLPADILGQVYEQFLGKVIRLTEGHQAKVEDKPEVKKAGGVYYTPTYIVDYIVKNTVGKLLEGKTPKQAVKLRILDPACGSGSFLIAAYQHLLDWHRDRYVAHDPKKWATGRKPLLYQGLGGEWKLTTAERKRILLQNIYGVDIDAQAVETTKLSLLLKVLEGESEQTLTTQLRFYHERALPDLGRNIKCGNSLIGPDFYQQSEMLFLDEEERYRINVFDWNAEFPDIMKAGGFDAVIGNPPYLFSAGQKYADYFSAKFSLTEYQTDFYVYFLEQALRVLKKRGMLGMIVSDSWLKGKHFSLVREHLLKSGLREIVVFNYAPFKGATIENSIALLTKNSKENTIDVNKFFAPADLRRINQLAPKDSIARGLIDISANPLVDRVLAKIEKNTEPLSRYCRLNRGVHAYRTDGYGRSKFGSGPQTKRDKEEQVYHARRKINSSYFPEVKGKHLDRYHYRWDGTYISYGDWLAESRSPEFFMQPKLAIRKIIARKLVCAFIPDPIVLDQSIYVAISSDGRDTDLRCLLGILASSISGWYLQRKHSIYDTLYPWFTKEQLARFPIPSIDKDRHDRMVSLVERMLELHKQLAAANTDPAKTNIRRQLDATDEQIDKLVYELYGLSADEIKIVEGAS
jgi:type I restriction-modification system DNA methylase subunit